MILAQASWETKGKDMKLTKFRVQDYRCINDSGWVELDDIAVIVGKNESGKTSLLKALWKLNPFRHEPYKIDREFPTGRRKEKSIEKTVVTAEFSLSTDEIEKIGAIHESAKGVTGIEVKKNYKGTTSFTFLPNQLSNKRRDIPWVVNQIDEQLSEPLALSFFTDHFKSQYRSEFKRLREEVANGGGSKRAMEMCHELNNKLQSYCNPQNWQNPNPHHQDLSALPKLSTILNDTKALIEKTPLSEAVDFIHSWLPTFVYMDDYRIFNGSAQLDEILERKKKNDLQDEDETVMLIMEMAGLNLEEEVKKGGQEDREQRALDMNDASQTLTNEIADRWSQKRYEVKFNADGQHFITFVKDIGQKGLVSLEERSKGFQWFFSFDMTLMYETKGKFENAVILLDEPGLHLHAAAQRDLLKRLKAYAGKNQLIYSTHLPFMIDFTRLDNIFVCEEKESEGTKVHKDWATADKDARFTLQAALGLSWSQSLFVGQFNLVVEGVTDYWFLATISTMLKDAGEIGIDEQLVITPAGGASRVAYIGTILHAQELKVAVLLDSDKEGDDAYKQLVHQWILKERLVLRVGEILGAQGNRTLEDLFDDDYYVKFAEVAYAKELGGKKLNLPSRPQLSLPERVGEAMKEAGVADFNKGRVAKRIMEDLAKKKLADLPSPTAEQFKKVIVAVNGIIASWRKK
ncbi:MAG TPA: AAA family ATPase [Verrucomicrobiae bacterium]|jgi:predicted ATP-dependent endonuclease of OLD family